MKPDPVGVSDDELTAKLEETEELLARVREEAEREDGVASEFSQVQGLKSEAVYYEEKKALLKEIFALNMDLRRLMAEQT